MIPIGGISLILHLLIIWKNKVSNKFGWRTETKLYKTKSSPLYQRIIIPIIFILILGFISTSLFSSVINDRNSIYNYALNLAYNCEIIESSNFEKKVIFRIDDIQVQAWEDMQFRMIDDALTRNIPLTLGVIPGTLDQSSILPSFLERRECNLEFALHGYGNEFEEFKNLSENEAFKKLNLGLESLEKNLNTRPTTFIPPNNIMSNGTKLALKRLSFNKISSYGNNILDYGATTYDFKKLKIIEVDNVINQCKKTFEKSNVCVVMIHPQDYTSENGEIDENKYKYYLEIIEEFKNMNVSFIKMKDY